MTQERKIDPNSFEALTNDEKAAARRAQLYATHKARGTLGIFYEMYPDLAPPPRRRDVERDDGRDR